MASRLIGGFLRKVASTWYAEILKYVLLLVTSAVGLYLASLVPVLGSVLGRQFEVNATAFLLAVALGTGFSSLGTYLYLRRDIIRLKRDASVDDVTSDLPDGIVLSPRVVMPKLRESVARALKENQPLSLILADIDGFRLFNDQHKYDVGDSVLRQFAQTLRVNIHGTNDLLLRYRHGDEFLVITPGTGGEMARTVVAERLRKAISTGQFQVGKKGEEETVSLTMSAGVTELSHERDKRERIEETIQILTDRLHGALDKAKETKDRTILRVS